MMLLSLSNNIHHLLHCFSQGVIQFYEYLFISGLLCYIIRFTSLPSRTTKALWIIILTFVSFLSCIFMAVFDIKSK